MRLIDQKFLKYKKQYFFQTAIATLFAFGTLLALGGYKHAPLLGIIGFTSLGSSAFITFASYDALAATPRCLLGGYIISVMAGALCWYFAHLISLLDVQLAYYFLFEIFGAISMGLAMLLMTVLDFEHPPAAGLALGLVMESWSVITLLIILMAVMLLVILKKWLRPWLINLV